MNHDNWYISLEYNYNNTQKTLNILEALEYKSHKVLYGRSFLNISTMAGQELENYINEYFEAYLLNVIYFGNVTNINEFEKTMRRVFLKKYGTNKENINFINEDKFHIKKLLDRFADIDKQTLWELKYTLACYIDSCNINNDKNFPADKLCFSEIEDQSFACLYEIGKSKNPNRIYNRYDISNDENIKSKISSSNLDLIITDDLNNISNFIYYVNIYVTYLERTCLHVE